jgi:hypothetical protein
MAARRTAQAAKALLPVAAVTAAVGVKATQRVPKAGPVFPDSRMALTARLPGPVESNDPEGTWASHGLLPVYDAMFADLTQVPEANITTTVSAAGGVTTTYLVPTLDLPLLRPLKAMGVPQGAIDILAAVLRPIIDSAYMRNDPPSSPRPTRRQAVASAAPTRSVESVRSAASLRSTAGVGDGTVAKPSGRAAKHQASASRS